MDEGVILSNKYRKIIFEEISSGENDILRIAKKNHIIINVANRTIIDFINNGILKKEGNKYILTKNGKKLANNLK